MKKLLRVLTLSLALSVIASIYLASPFAEQVWATGGCWYGCTDGPQKSRKGCSVQFYRTAGEGAFGIYEYTCGNEKIYCTYKYDCDGGAPVAQDVDLVEIEL